MSSTTQTPPIGVRLQPELRRFIEQQAKDNFRSLSSEIAMRLERTRQQDLAPSMQPSAHQPNTQKGQ